MKKPQASQCRLDGKVRELIKQMLVQRYGAKKNGDTSSHRSICLSNGSNLINVTFFILMVRDQITQARTLTYK